MSEWERVLETQQQLQHHFPECVLVGGTAAALHAGHRHSLDGDHVMQDLRLRFPEVLTRLEQLAGWRSRRIIPPVEILGNLEGVPTGIRQLRRTAPLQTQVIAGIRVPTLAEMLRVKGWLIVTRNATRDFLDFCALATKLGDGFVDALSSMDVLYPQETGESVRRQLAQQLAEPKPRDLQGIDLRRYRGLQPPWDEWSQVESFCRQLGQRLFRSLLRLPATRDGAGDAP